MNSIKTFHLSRILKFCRTFRKEYNLKSGKVYFCDDVVVVQFKHQIEDWTYNLEFSYSGELEPENCTKTIWTTDSDGDRTGEEEELYDA